MLKPEKYKGLTIIFSKYGNKIIAGFEKNPHIVSGFTKVEAFEKMKEVISGMSSSVLRTYIRHNKTIRELEDL